MSNESTSSADHDAFPSGRCDACGKYEVPASCVVGLCDDCYSKSGACCAGEDD